MPSTGQRAYKHQGVLRELYWRREMSLRAIAEKFDVVDATIRYWMDEHDIPRRSKGEARRAQNRYDVWFGTNVRGRELIEFREFGEHIRIPVQWLVLLPDFTLAELRDMDTHHLNRIPWDNRPANVWPVPHWYHSTLH